MTTQPFRTLIIHTGGIGDLLLALPTIAQIPAPIELAGHRDRLELAVAGRLAEAAHALESIEFHTVFDSPSARLREFLGRFNRAVVWMRDSDDTIRRGLSECGISHVDVFPGLPDAGWSRHASEYYADCLQVAAPRGFHLDIDPVGEPLDIAIHPGSGSPTKNWPVENFHALAAFLAEAGRRITWCLGPAEVERDPRTQFDGDVLQCESLVALAGRLASARVFIGNDSGITHLAAALGIPTVAIFGPTNPAVWEPRGERVRVLRGNPWPRVSEAIVALSS
jgi:ADP-heptose:LPS heptosyltransferase